MNSAELEKIQSIIGYEFENTALVDWAFTHSSYVNEHEATGNERIEFLGDCVLNFLVGERLYDQDRTASEGKLSSRRAALVSRAPLARIVDTLGLSEFLKVGVGVDKSAFSDKARSDLFEAVLGAVYTDGGLEPCKKVLDKIFYPYVRPERDYKSELQRLVGNVTYDTTPSETDGFVSVVDVRGVEYKGVGRSKHLSEIAAAKAALEDLQKD